MDEGAQERKRNAVKQNHVERVRVLISLAQDAFTDAS